MKPEDQKKVIVGCYVVKKANQTKLTVVRRQGMRVRVAFLDGKESWLEIKDLELGENEENVGGGEVEVETWLG